LRPPRGQASYRPTNLNLAAKNPLALLLRANALQSWRKLKSVGENSKLLTGVIVGFIFGYAWFSFLLFYKGLRFVSRFPGLDTLLTERLLFLLFAFLFFLLLFSNLIISYTNLFRNRETAFLLTLPIPRQTIFRWKLMESTALASWAFLFLIAPLLIAYGMTYNAHWHFYASTLLLVGLFIVMPSVFGAFAAVTLARYLDRRAFQVSLVTICVFGIIAAAFWFRPEQITDEMLETRVITVLDQMLARTRFAQFPLLPSYWLSASVLNYCEGALRASFFFALVLLSNSLFFGFLAMTSMGGMFYEASSAVHSRPSVMGRWAWARAWAGRKRGNLLAPTRFERLLALVPGLRPERRALVLKDIRVFWRDTTQWGQSLVLFGLLAAYIINLRHFSQQLTNPFWVDLVSYLNLGACSLNLATLTTRFVYPQFSLEGKRVWIVGMAPLGLMRVVTTKYLLATVCSLAITITLVWGSCHMLRLPFERTLFFSYSVFIMTLALNGLAMGLGVLYPNFREDNPSKIVSGFGGTFCLVISFLYILASVAALAIGAPWARAGTQSLPVIIASLGAFAVFSLLVGYLPLKLALRKVATLEL
jgi:ABC-2 type transport system permease protein